VRIDQFLPTFAAHDAIGTHVLQARRALRHAGFESDIWAEDVHPPLQREAGDYRTYPPAPSSRADVILYHASTDSSMVSVLAARREALVIDYHNITPARYFARWEPVAAASMERARAELRQLAPVTVLALADSPFNQAELVEVGYRRTSVSPLLVDYQRYDGPADARALVRLERRRASGGARWLFVGRLAPNKCQHDVIGAFAAYRRLFDARARLTLVGGMTSRLYFRSLRRLAEELDLGDSIELVDAVPFGELLAYYRTSDIFVCLSEHEGFCIPIVEALHLGLPVVAFRAAAVPDTVAGGGVLIDDKDPLMVACAVDRVLSDATLRAALIRAGRSRADDFSLDKTSKLLVEPLSELAGDRSVSGG
jgi:glycosyltransferase involved in cell wall biosynthesis